MAFEYLKKAFTDTPVLVYYDPEKHLILESDASDHTIAAILSQYGDDGFLHPIVFFSRKLLPAECNYTIYEKEMLAIVAAFREWRKHVEGSRHKLHVITDHPNLEYFQTTKITKRRQARWSMELQAMDYEIEYRPGKKGVKPDVLTQRPGLEPIKTEGPVMPTTVHINWAQGAQYFEEICKAMKEGKHSRLEVSDLRENNRDVEYRAKKLIEPKKEIFVPLISAHHDPATMGHPGREQTLRNLMQ